MWTLIIVLTIIIYKIVDIYIFLNITKSKEKLHKFAHIELHIFFYKIHFKISRKLVNAPNNVFAKSLFSTYS
jgi:hypothetical protein